MNKNYKYPKNERLIKQLKPYWKKFNKLNSKYLHELFLLEEQMSKKVKIKQIEFFFVDNECIGIGNIIRDMELIHGKELEEEIE